MLGLSEARWEDKGGKQQQEVKHPQQTSLGLKAKHTFRFPGIIRVATSAPVNGNNTNNNIATQLYLSLLVIGLVY